MVGLSSVEMLGEKARLISFFMNKICDCVRGDDLTRLSTREWVDTFNALMIPKCYVYVDNDWLIHVVMIKGGSTDLHTRRYFTAIQGYTKLGQYTFLPSTIAHTADVIWNFNATTGMWTTLKDRTGEFEKHCPIKFGGIPERKANDSPV